MKLKLFSLVFFVVFVLGTFPMQNVSALSCVETFPLIGTVSSITENTPFTEVTLDRFYMFDGSDFFIDDAISIDRYENIVQEYVRNNFQLSEIPSSTYVEWLNKISIPTNAFNKIQITDSDIIINGPPHHVCSYRFTGSFTKDGKLKHVIINDNYQDYSYLDSKLDVDPGKELECGDNNVCKMEVNFTIDGDPFTLSPGQSHIPLSGEFKSISLIDSSDLKAMPDGTTLFDWGFNTHVTYVLEFSEAIVQPDTEPTTDPEPQPKQIEPVEKLSFFQKIWRWFTSLFQ
jgi:hypothetical protein